MSGAVRMSTYVDYMKAAGRPCVVVIVCLLTILSVASYTLANYWLSYWINEGSGVSVDNSYKYVITWSSFCVFAIMTINFTYILLHIDTTKKWALSKSDSTTQ